MYKYLFITYGEPGWRGVQIRSLRMANYLPREEVLFWNMYDSSIITEWNFDVETKNAGLIDPLSITFPESVEVVVFSDLPSNELFEYAVYRAALREKRKIVICEQLYRRGQMKESAFDAYAKQANLFLVNALSSFHDEETDVVKIVPPQIETDLTDETTTVIKKKYNIPENVPIIFGSGYHEGVFHKILKLTEELNKRGVSFFTIISGHDTIESTEYKKNLLILPYTAGDEYFQLLKAADVVVVKFGFLQILESLSLHKPTIILGEAGAVLQQENIIDKTIRDHVIIDNEMTPHTIDHIEKLLKDADFRNKEVAALKKIHDGQTYGAQKASNLIQQLVDKPSRENTPVPKKCVIFINDESLHHQEWLHSQTDIYPLSLVITTSTELQSMKRFPEGLLDTTLSKLQMDRQGAIIQDSFSEIMLFSKRKGHGFTQLSSWFDTWLKHVVDIITVADEIYLTDKGKKMIDPLLDYYSLQQKVIQI
jgi:hypothetical protein